MSSSSNTLLTVNGQPRWIAPGCTIERLLEEEGEPADHVIVEVNGRFVPSGDHKTRVLLEGDNVELVLPAFGG